MALLQRIRRIPQYVPAPWLIAFALVICFFAFSLRQKSELTSHHYDSSGFPHIYMQQVTTREFDAQGRLHYQLATPQVTHYQLNPDAPSDSDYTLIEQPNMAFFDAGQKTQSPQVDAQHRHARVAHKGGRGQHGAIAT